MKWNAQQINRDEFNEGTDINFRFESHMFSVNKGWVKRPPPQRFNTVRQSFKKGTVIFRQTVNPSQYEFSIYVIAVIKQTANLEIMYTSSILSYMPRGATTLEEYCDMWSSRTNQILNSDDLKNCPCNLDSVNLNSDFLAEPKCELPGGNCVDGNQCYIMG